MNRAAATRDAWYPQTAEDRSAIVRELHKILVSPQFSSSKRYPALLQYIVEKTLVGKSELLKERTLGVEVFDRPPTYDTNADTVVRYTAGEVRKRLLLYYSEHGRGSGIRILLPAGSYVPEFVHGSNDLDEAEGLAGSAGASTQDAHPSAEQAGRRQEPGLSVSPTLAGNASNSDQAGAIGVSQAPWNARRFIAGRLLWAVAAAIIVVTVLVGVWWRYSNRLPATALEQFWGPVARDQHSVLICSGGVVFQQNNFSGVLTADKNIEYPFVSMQIASGIVQVSGLLQRFGVSSQLLSSPSTPLSELREHSVVLLGGYNNQWAMRLLQSQRFQFSPEPLEWIVDRTQPQAHWTRDHSLSYSNADDYAIVARFHDATTDSWVVVLAGLGRNGTEAAAQFATSPHYLQLLKDQMGKDFADRNIEVVLRVNVIDGKTGAPTILAVNAQ
jgi:hypothetical protein